MKDFGSKTDGYEKWLIARYKHHLETMPEDDPDLNLPLRHHGRADVWS